jgi:hypothetical protein
MFSCLLLILLLARCEAFQRLTRPLIFFGKSALQLTTADFKNGMTFEIGWFETSTEKNDCVV